VAYLSKTSLFPLHLSDIYCVVAIYYFLLPTLNACTTEDGVQRGQWWDRLPLESFQVLIGKLPALAFYKQQNRSLRMPKIQKRRETTHIETTGEWVNTQWTGTYWTATTDVLKWLPKKRKKKKEKHNEKVDESLELTSIITVCR